MPAVDFKKTQKELYMPKTTPSVIYVPELNFIMVNGSGDPNNSADYQNALEILYGLSWSIKMSKMSGTQPAGYYEYVMPPLEGLWWHKDGGAMVDLLDKDSFCWISMIRQPEFVTAEAFNTAKLALAKKKPDVDLTKARLEKFIEGLCVQVMHIGPYDSEPASIAALERYATANGYAIDINEARRHHEIYLSDPRKTAPEKLKTVIRYPVKKVI